MYASYHGHAGYQTTQYQRAYTMCTPQLDANKVYTFYGRDRVYPTTTSVPDVHQDGIKYIYKYPELVSKATPVKAERYPLPVSSSPDVAIGDVIPRVSTPKSTSYGLASSDSNTSSPFSLSSLDFDDDTPPPSPVTFYFPDVTSAPLSPPRQPIKIQITDDVTPEKRRVHSCSVCNRKFQTSSGLISHMRRHTGERPYTCRTCGQSFSDRSTIAKHRRTHTGTKPYTCDVCGRDFSQSGNMLRHKRSMHRCWWQYKLCL